MVKSQQVSCTANGGQVQIMNVTIDSGAPTFQLPMAPGAMTLAAGQSMTFNVDYHPDGNAGDQQSGDLTVSYGGMTGNASIMIPLQGTVQEPPPTTQAIAIILNWDNDATDQDTHLVRPGGMPFDSGLPPVTQGTDCFFEDCVSPFMLTWPPGNDPTYDPHLDRDTVSGVISNMAPEHLNVQNAQAGAYNIYAHYFSDHGASGSTNNVTVTVFVGGTQVGMYTQPLQCNDVWHVGTVNWTGTTGTFAPDTSKTTSSLGCCGGGC
jgi:hypothetical protein